MQSTVPAGSKKTIARNTRVTDMRLVLQEELASRCSKNPSYSLRSFAQFLAISPAALSALLNGKRPLTNKMKERLGLKLGLSFADLAKIKAKPHGNSKFKARQATTLSFHQITVDIFAIISEPHHYALMELIKTDDFQLNSRWIGKRLGITPSEINFSLERLERAGLLRKDGSGHLDITHGFSTDIREGLTSEAQRHFQVRVLQSAISAVETVSVADRDNTSMTMAINICDLPKAKQMIRDFRRQFCQQMEDRSALNEVYQLTVSFVPVTRIEKTRRKP